ncbi:imidazole glycerol phosphate synthase subunit HisH [Tropicibacter sp. Alg240-R139]|uniref:imidazole glycerol phosphate synthase subunit HisH n=1 Tax=Tropicibacter sp. Alg240-R139 TaxID=2305991 RepID=UPI0013DF25D0|nr:imidazole glycerol phosphate synthase subunit HisH [Tropicibacter sp. Alg240-R139]
MTVVSIVDYGVGNLRSVINALEHIGAQAELVSDPVALRKSGKLLLPGVGSYRIAMEQFQASGLADTLMERVTQDQIPMLGICVGMQLMTEHGTEDGGAPGLGLVPGVIDKFDADTMKAKGLKVPHVGFNTVRPKSGSLLFKDLGDGIDVYFTHSFRLASTGDDHVGALCNYGVDFVAAVEHEHVVATQFHPEKSQANGLAILRNFMDNF